MTNYKPHADAGDKAFWTRVCSIPFGLRFIDNPKAANERKADSDLKQKLHQEASGILAWLVRGCLTWQQDKLDIPESIQMATKECIVPGCSSMTDAFSVQPEGKLTGDWSGYGAWMCRKCWDPSEEVTVQHGPERGMLRKRGWVNIVELVMRCEGLNFREAKRFILRYEGRIVPMDQRPALVQRKTEEQWLKENLAYLDQAQHVSQADRELVLNYLSFRCVSRPPQARGFSSVSTRRNS